MLSFWAAGCERSIRTVCSHPSRSKNTSSHAHCRRPTEAFLPGTEHQQRGTRRIRLHIRVKGGKAEPHQPSNHRARPPSETSRAAAAPPTQALRHRWERCWGRCWGRVPTHAPWPLPVGVLAARCGDVCVSLLAAWRPRVSERRAGSEWASLVLPGGRAPGPGPDGAPGAPPGPPTCGRK